MSSERLVMRKGKTRQDRLPVEKRERYKTWLKTQPGAPEEEEVAE